MTSMNDTVHSLLAHISIGKGDVVSIVGSGGKTTLMFTLARELAARGDRVITTTTTKIFPPSPAECPSVLVWEDEETLLGEVRKRMTRERHLTVAAGRLKEKVKEKLIGLPPGMVDEMRGRGYADVILVEADGARNRPLKAPNDTEPVVPAGTAQVIAVAGLDGIGKPNTEEHVFRPERFAVLSGIAEGAVVTPEAVAQAMLHRDGLLRDLPPGAQATIILNKADGQEQRRVGRRLARMLLEGGDTRIGAVLVTTLLPATAVVLSSARGTTPTHDRP